MVFSEEQKRRHVCAMNALLRFTNANQGSCIYFEPPMESEHERIEGMRIAQDLWEDDTMVRLFLERQRDFYKVDHDLVASWTTVVKGPLMLMEAYGNRGLFMCEGYVFEVFSVNRPFSDMDLSLPDMVMTTLVPFEGVITTDGFMLHHRSPMEDFGCNRIRQQFEAGKASGIISSASHFKEVAQQINLIHETKGLDPLSFAIYHQMIDYLNNATRPTCFSYEYYPGLRDWSGNTVDLSSA